MSKFKHHSYFHKEKNAQSYLFPHVCLKCRKSFKKPQSQKSRNCPQCGDQLIALSRKFSAPKASDVEQWKKIQYLIEHGFLFQSVFELREDRGHDRVEYPQTLKEAKEFVFKYKEQAIENAF